MKQLWGAWSSLHHAATVIVMAATLQKGFVMFKQGFSVALKAFGIVALVVAAVEESGTADGAAKKAQAQTQIEQLFDAQLPDWGKAIVAPLVGVLIDLAVSFANRNGFFTKSAAA